jgi:proteasome assembly chaperone (PAC2) family protein
LIELEGLPELVAPIMVAAFEGWNDAADAASNAVKHLADQFEATYFAALDAEEYYDFQVNRPIVSGHGVDRAMLWPTTRLSVVRMPEPPAGGQRHDLVLVHGIEPNMRWRGFCEELLDLASNLGVELVVVLGALLADVPHSRPVPVNGTSNDEDVRQGYGLEEPTYEGPSGIVGVLQEACQMLDMPALSFWAAVPHYVAQAPCPKATLALLRRIEDVLDVPVPMGELPESAQAWENSVDELAAEDNEVAEYVRSLEQAKDTAELPEASGEAIAREFERYLRRRDRRTGDDPRGG